MVFICIAVAISSAFSNGTELQSETSESIPINSKYDDDNYYALQCSFSHSRTQSHAHDYEHIEHMVVLAFFPSQLLMLLLWHMVQYNSSWIRNLCKL